MKLAKQPIDALAQLLIQIAESHSQPEIVLIGGQALYLWASHYLIDEMTLEEFAHVTSFDLDFLGKKAAIEQCAEAWGGTFKLPGFEDFTPQSGKIALEDEDGDPVSIDFLGQVDGISNGDLDKGLDLIPLSYGGQVVDVPLLSPPLCLQARIHNSLHRGYSNERYDREIVRVGLAIKATRYYISDLLTARGAKPGLKILKYLKKIMMSQDARRLYRDHGISVLDAIPFQHPVWPEAFREQEYPRLLARQKSYLKKPVLAGN
ncbi:MAG: hypothetical protein P1U47_14105 [Zhongshania sp.]|uniref:hypothetical protein n=1 Tax=Zhongshania sp. TaxID=1971902 RepID=UPI00262B63BC|nr:hypothetical protein [Zhongshania sp.]MDF1693509.1 hypothetical protein [Zhongshania sp.]